MSRSFMHTAYFIPVAALWVVIGIPIWVGILLRGAVILMAQGFYSALTHRPLNSIHEQVSSYALYWWRGMQVLHQGFFCPDSICDHGYTGHAFWQELFWAVLILGVPAVYFMRDGIVEALASFDARIPDERFALYKFMLIGIVFVLALVCMLAILWFLIHKPVPAAMAAEANSPQGKRDLITPRGSHGPSRSRPPETLNPCEGGVPNEITTCAASQHQAVDTLIMVSDTNCVQADSKQKKFPILTPHKKAPYIDYGLKRFGKNGGSVTLDDGTIILTVGVVNGSSINNITLQLNEKSGLIVKTKKEVEPGCALICKSDGRVVTATVSELNWFESVAVRVTETKTASDLSTKEDCEQAPATVERHESDAT